MFKANAFRVFNQKWNTDQTLGTSGGIVTYSFATQNFAGQFAPFDLFIDDELFKKEITESFAAWERIADIRFFEVPDNVDSDIRLGWTQVDGASGVLGSATIPSSGPLASVIIELDPDENWFVLGDAPQNATDFSATVTHEIGHAIGIDHSPDDQALMHANYSHSIFSLQDNDIQAARFIYGDNNAEEVDIYRYFKPIVGGHFFTADVIEKDSVDISDGYTAEGIGFRGLSREATDVPGSTSVYRFLNTGLGSHFFTTSEVERDHVLTQDGFVFEGVGFRAFDLNTSSTTSVYRFFNLEAGGHFFTADPAEKDAVSELQQFRYEGIAFYTYTEISA